MGFIQQRVNMPYLGIIRIIKAIIIAITSLYQFEEGILITMIMTTTMMTMTMTMRMNTTSCLNGLHLHQGDVRHHHQDEDRHHHQDLDLNSTDGREAIVKGEGQDVDVDMDMDLHLGVDLDPPLHHHLEVRYSIRLKN